MKKRPIISGIVLLVIFMLAGCETGKKTDFYPRFLTEHEWTHYTYCDETIDFYDNGDYSYHCACGEPVGNSDLFDSYQYNNKTKQITLSPKGPGDNIQVLRYSPSRLLLCFSDGVKEFIDQKDPLESKSRPNLDYDIENYTQAFSSYSELLTEDGEWASAPAGYHQSPSRYQNYIVKETISDDASFYFWHVTEKETEEGPQFSHTLKKITLTQANSLLEKGPAPAYLWYGKTGKIEKAVFFSI